MNFARPDVIIQYTSEYMSEYIVRIHCQDYTIHIYIYVIADINRPRVRLCVRVYVRIDGKVVMCHNMCQATCQTTGQRFYMSEYMSGMF